MDSSICPQISKWYTQPEAGMPLPKQLKAPDDWSCRQIAKRFKRSADLTGTPAPAPTAPVSTSPPVFSSMSIDPFVHVDGCFFHNGIAYRVPLLPSDIGNSSLEDSDEILLVTLTNPDGSAGWNFSQVRPRVVMKHQNILLWTDLLGIAKHVEKNVDLLNSRCKSLDKALNKTYKPYKQSELMVTMVVAEEFIWHPIEH